MALQDKLSKQMLYFVVAGALGLNVLQAPNTVKIIRGADTVNATQMVSNFTAVLDSTDIKVTSEYEIAPQFDSLVMKPVFDSAGVCTDSQLVMTKIRDRRVGGRNSAKANTSYITQVGDTLVNMLFVKLGPNMKPISAHIYMPLPNALVASYLTTTEK